MIITFCMQLLPAGCQGAPPFSSSRKLMPPWRFTSLLLLALHGQHQHDREGVITGMHRGVAVACSRSERREVITSAIVCKLVE